VHEEAVEEHEQAKHHKNYGRKDEGTPNHFDDLSRSA
jgi:hypothetical protein